MTPGTLLITCEHAGNEVPPPYAPLFHGQESTLSSHLGWDIGALPAAKALAAALHAPLFFTTVTRLLIDTNRSLGHKRLFSKFSRDLPPEQRTRVIQDCYQPHREVACSLIDEAIDQGERVLHLAIHSFTPVLNGATRRVDLGLLYDSRRAEEQQLCRQWQDALAAARPDLRIRRNNPYRGTSDGLATRLRKQRPETDYLGIEVEINQQLLALAQGQREIAALLGQTLLTVLGQEAPSSPGHDPGDEIVAIVDANDRLIGQCDRRTMRHHRLAHRAAYILVTNSRGQVFVQKRTMTKDIYPGYHDIAAGGVVLAGESYEESARRELAEELGVTGELEYLFDNFYTDDQNTVWGRVFRCRHEGPFVLQASEVESGEFLDPGTILTAMSKPITPDGLTILHRLLQ